MSKRFKTSILIGLIFLLGVYLYPSSAKALTTAEIKAKIIGLQQQIAQLQQQLLELGGEEAVWCHTFNVNLRYGDTGSEVKALQTALEKEGFSISSSEKSRSYFGDFTASAVVEFQEEYAPDILAYWGLRRGTGYVGTTTRAKLNQLYECEERKPRVPVPIFEKEEYIDETIKGLSESVQRTLETMPSALRAERIRELRDIKRNIKEQAGTWKANYNRIFLWRDEEIKGLLGLKLPKSIEERVKEEEIFAPQSLKSVGKSLPASFDWRDKHSLNYITPVKDQSEPHKCASCWAFAAIGALEAKGNVYYNNPDLDADLSEQDLVSCSNAGSCRGGYVGSALRYVINKGVANETCFPYTSIDADGCDALECGFDPALCSEKCSNWEEEAWGLSSFTSISRGNIYEIKKSLIEKGPIITGMAVYKDFIAYQSGIYQHSYGNFLGFHAVVIVGYGTYDGLTYWIVKNSWGTDWGDDGYFKIFAGDSGIDSSFIVQLNEPIPSTTQNIICTDKDEDGYCSWGASQKPNDCPICDNVIQDCNDSDHRIYEGCGADIEPKGTLEISSDPTGTEVYVKDLSSGAFYYRGKTPLTINLNTGKREVKITKFLYADIIKTVDIRENKITSLDVTLGPDPIYQKGWPQEVGRPIESSPSLVDIDGDGKLEVIIFSNASGAIRHDRGKVYIWHHDGIIFEGWPKTIGESDVIQISSPTVEDIDGDGTPEIIVATTYGKLYVFHSSGEVANGWPKSIGETYSTAALGDLDDDGDLEIVIGGSYKVWAFHHNGDVVDGWPKNVGGAPFGGHIFATPALGDIDNDGDLEVIVGALDKKVYAWHHDGTLVNGWPKITSTYITASSASLADVDNDGDLEIFLGSGDSLYTWHHDGKPVDGWPQKVDYKISSTPALGDMDGDGDIEIVIGSADTSMGIHRGKMYAWHHDGTPVEGWPVEDLGRISSSPSMGDLDEDGDMEIVVGTKMPDHKVYVWHHDGALYDSWLTQNRIYSSPALGDIDNDGDIEIVIGSSDGRLYIYDLPGAYDASYMEWPMFNHDTHHAGWYVSPKPLLPDLTIEDITVDPDSDQVTATVKNKGNKEAGIFHLEFWMDDISKGTFKINRLGAGGTKVVSESYGSGLLTGEHQVKVITDYTNVVKESNEDNNQMTIQADFGPEPEGCGDGKCSQKVVLLQEGEEKTIAYDGKNYTIKCNSLYYQSGYPRADISVNDTSKTVALREDYTMAGLDLYVAHLTVEPLNQYSGLANIIFYAGKETKESCPEDCESACLDSEQGKNYYQWGYAYKGMFGYFEHCIDPEDGRAIYSKQVSKLREYYCRNNEVEKEEYTCPNGCLNGACVKEEKSITVVFPNGGEEWVRGDVYDITWKSSGTDKVNIYLMDYSEPQIVCECIAGTYCPPCGAKLIVSNHSAVLGRYDWKISSSQSLGSEYKILIWDADYPIDARDTSDGYFSIVSEEQEDLVSGTLSVDKISVNTGEDIALTIKAQDDQGVSKIAAWYQGKWHTKTCPWPLIHPSEPPTTCTQTFTFSESESGIYYYRGYVYGKKLNGTIEGAYTTPYRVKVSVTSPVTTCTDSDGGKDYYTKGMVTHCTGGNGLNTDCNITYDICLKTGFLREYYCDGSDIAYIDYQCLYGCEDGACKTSITVLSPNGGEKWEEGRNYDITWKSSGIDKVGIYLANVVYEDPSTELYCVYDPSCISKYCPPCSGEIVTNISASLGKYSWTISNNPKILSAKIFIEAVNVFPKVSDKSDNDFDIMGATSARTDTDGGKDYYTKGTVTSEDGTIFTDYCLDGQLYETYCEPNYSAEWYSCPSGCEDGVCLLTPSDTGRREKLSSMLASIQVAIENLMKSLGELKK